MNSQPFVSILTACYNSKKFISETIESVLAQTYSNFEMILVDDGSAEPIKEIVESYNSPKLRYYFIENRGPAGARNYAARQSLGDYVAFLDHDDLWVPQKLEQQLEELERRNAVWVVSGSQTVNAFTGKVLETQQSPDYYRNVFFDILQETYLWAFSSVMIRKEVFFDVGLFDESIWFMDDRDLYLRIAQEYPLAYLSAIHVISKVHGSNITTSLSVEKKLKIHETLLQNAQKLNVDIPPEVIDRSNQAMYRTACVDFLRMNDVQNTRRMLKLIKTDARSAKFLLYKFLCMFDDETIIRIMTKFRKYRARMNRSKLYPTTKV